MNRGRKEDKSISIVREGREKIMFPAVGRLAVSKNPGEVIVEFNGNGPKMARLLSGLDRFELTKENNRGREVLLVFEEGDLNRPVIVGLIENPLEGLVSMEVPPSGSQDAKDAFLDGKHLTLSAEEEVFIKCGKGSITIRKDGKIIIKGTHIFSKSSGPHRIKGGHVDIN